MSNLIVAPDLTVHDTIVLQNLIDDIERYNDKHLAPTDGDEGYASQESLGEKSKDDEPCRGVSTQRDAKDIRKLKGLNDATSQDFEPSVFSSFDLRDLPHKLPAVIYQNVIVPYVAWGRKIVRHETDVIMLTHLILYFTLSVPSAIMLFRNFNYIHGVAHMLMQFWFTGTYTLMMHQHIHMNGILSKNWAVLRFFDTAFPYITDPLMGHTWNTYFYHHVKHHHVEGNGPHDLSSTIRYQRDDIFHFLHYVGRFIFLVWFDLPRYFFRKGQTKNGLKTGFWELGNYAFLYTLYCLHSKATTFVFLGPLALMRLGLMVGNWGQHAFVDADEPDSDFRSSITLIDVPSNRYCYNDGYHTSHHLNPRRHWRDHPTSFLQQKKTYIREKALVFHNIDYLMVTVKLLQKDYLHLAKCLVPVGEQIGMTIEERATMLRRHTRKFEEDEIREKFRDYFKTK
ncbi:hypothetical protein COL5a_000987 [Colletotrichum fioriniae]|uniref:Fatty acid desaturase n=1 Tax=Colletotrichum fioriniae PJ7 TaxID=1445577 RepID=A0A010S0P7_9PEZI|nr:uncharacterized protein COL516b_006868 [Colletotrichum fioriniae]EXF84174.1 fatty acid desaturase [Colletotrichum fioriniae PJ7]KAJ0302829.1 hypothetical protein COL516b_006868 [Colletotrichum fioriniae]KAJ0333285.1 hypothetical protein COL5a_000987 [Colletotrichum fioriniae]KAJ3941448.1 hypothetical protein N0V96_008156 [Colletotrichum fioriniae]